MMDDHALLSRARNHLADALKALLKAEIMDATDFRAAREQAEAALGNLDALLRLAHRNSP